MPNEQLSLLDEIRVDAPALTDEQAVVLACQRLLEEAEAEPPIPVERVASLRGIVEVCQDTQEWAGVLAPIPNRGLVVTVRSTDAYERQRFTICHEVGHTFFPGFHQQRSFRCNGAKSRLEQLCDLAGSELLLPRAYVSTDLERASFDLTTVEQLAQRYEASIEATALKTVDLWPREPVMLLALHVRHKPAEAGKHHQVEPRLRLDYAHGSGRWPYALPHKSVAEDSPLAAALQGELIDLTHTNVDELFASAVGPVELHARPYGANGRVLALIRPTRGDR